MEACHVLDWTRSPFHGIPLHSCSGLGYSGECNHGYVHISHCTVEYARPAGADMAPLALMLLATWFSVDGCYAIYWYWKNPSVLVLMRDVNWPASLALYGMCGILWLFQGSLKQLFSEIKRQFSLLRGNK